MGKRGSVGARKDYGEKSGGCGQSHQICMKLSNKEGITFKKSHLSGNLGKESLGPVCIFLWKLHVNNLLVSKQKYQARITDYLKSHGRPQFHHFLHSFFYHFLFTCICVSVSESVWMYVTRAQVTMENQKKAFQCYIPRAGAIGTRCCAKNWTRVLWKSRNCSQQPNDLPKTHSHRLLHNNWRHKTYQIK